MTAEKHFVVRKFEKTEKEKKSRFSGLKTFDYQMQPIFYSNRTSLGKTADNNRHAGCRPMIVPRKDKILSRYAMEGQNNPLLNAGVFNGSNSSVNWLWPHSTYLVAKKTFWNAQMLQNP